MGVYGGLLLCVRLYLDLFGPKHPPTGIGAATKRNTNSNSSVIPRDPMRYSSLCSCGRPNHHTLRWEGGHSLPHRHDTHHTAVFLLLGLQALAFCRCWRPEGLCAVVPYMGDVCDVWTRASPKPATTTACGASTKDCSRLHHTDFTNK